MADSRRIVSERRTYLRSLKTAYSMTNGGHWKSAGEWNRVEAPVLGLDNALSEFAKQYGLEVTKNHKGWPERSIEWGEGIRRLIQVFLADEDRLTFNVWICASQDRDGGRYWKQEMLVKAQPIAAFRDAFPELLRQGRQMLESWQDKHLALAARLDMTS